MICQNDSDGRNWYARGKYIVMADTARQHPEVAGTGQHRRVTAYWVEQVQGKRGGI